jgi:hypothetical protein
VLGCSKMLTGCADWSVVFWMGEKDDPVVTDELVEVDGAVGSLSLEVGGNSSQTKAILIVSFGLLDPEAGGVKTYGSARFSALELMTNDY